MRESLRTIALTRLGQIDHALLSQKFFRETIVADLVAADAPKLIEIAAPIIVLRGGATHAESSARAERVTVFGVDDRYWKLSGNNRDSTVSMPDQRAVVLNQTLADELNAEVGDDVLLRVGKPNAVAAEALLGRRDDTALTIRVKVAGIVGDSGIGAFTLHPRQQTPPNAFVPLHFLQKAIKRADRVNALLFSTGLQESENTATVEELKRLTAQVIRSADLGVRVRVQRDLGYIAVESDAMLLEPALERATGAAAADVGVRSIRVLSYLANEIAVVREGEAANATNAIPYSIVAAIDTLDVAGIPLNLEQPPALHAIGPGRMLLNKWAADDLHAKVGEVVTLTYYVTEQFGRLETETSSFVVDGIVPIEGAAADPGFSPDYPGMTDMRDMADWDPPFPVDLKQIRKKDETYWDDYRTTPKAFVSLQDGQRLWANQPDRFGRVTSVRVIPPTEQDITAFASALESRILGNLDIAEVGVRIEPLRTQAIAAGKGSTDFGGLFIGFSFFLIISGVLLIALLNRLSVERRASEIGVLLASGINQRTVTKLLIVQGAITAAMAVPFGLLGAAAYAWFMLYGLRVVWSAAVNAPHLVLQVSGSSLLIGFSISISMSIASIAWSVRGLTRVPVASLLSGFVQPSVLKVTHARQSKSNWVAAVSAAAVVIVMAFHLVLGTPDKSTAFFLGGSAALVASLALVARWMLRDHHELIRGFGINACARLGIRNASRYPTRSMLAIGLIGSATFLIVSLEAFRLDATSGGDGADSGTGGFSLYAESAAPITFDLNTAHGRDALSISSAASAIIEQATIYAFRLRDGDETSCLNLYQPEKPRIIGASDAMIKRGGFAFSSTLATTEEERLNPWRLLERGLEDGAVPVIGDESAVRWQLHLGLGQDIVVSDDRGDDVTLRFVGLLKGSALQGELIVAESALLKMFPGSDGYSFFLIESPAGRAAQLAETLERDLAKYGFDVAYTVNRLRDYYAVQNTYLTTFQTLGGLGLVLGTIGLAAVLLRNVQERRRELAMLQALGFGKRLIASVVLAENTVLVVAGLLAGLVPAIIAVAPNVWDKPEALPWLSITVTVGAVFVVCLATSAMAVAGSLRAPLIHALRSE